MGFERDSRQIGIRNFCCDWEHLDRVRDRWSVRRATRRKIADSACQMPVLINLGPDELQLSPSKG